MNALSRFVVYQRERFPLVAHGPLIFAFAFSASSYSRMCRGEAGMPAPTDILLGGLVALGLFFQLRLADEWKDRHEDARWRPYRPVPRGLVSFRDLGVWAGISLAVQVTTILVWRPMLWVWMLPAALWLCAMTFEFGIGGWLRKNHMVYAASHMMIMPLFDLFTTAIDWHRVGAPPRGVEIFLLLSYLNGFVLEIGRKLRAPCDEEPGVETYSRLYGARNGALLWLGTLVGTALAAGWACLQIPNHEFSLAALAVLAPVAAWAGIAYLRQPGSVQAKRLETASGLWTLGMYLIVGATPLVVRALEWGP
jgi:4-hydroxybenzoate polyprenyltransferase